MTDQAAHIASIIDAPEYDSPRLVYADWLDEHGQPERAEFIRVQCEDIRLCGRVAKDGYGVGLRNRKGKIAFERSLQLESQYCFDWYKFGPGHRPYWERGFVKSISVSAADWLANADSILREHPVQEVRLTTMPEVELHPANRRALDRPSEARLSGCKWRQYATPTFVSTNLTVAESLLRLEWPRVKRWELPSVTPTTRYTTAIAGAAIEAGDFIVIGENGEAFPAR